MADPAELFTSISPPQSDYRVSFDPCPRRVTVEFHGVTLADSSRAMIMRETRLAPVYYFPRSDVRTDLLSRTRHHSYCPFRGSASHWTLKVGEQVVENAAWSYESPNPEAAAVKDYLAFYQDRMDTVCEADVVVSAASDARARIEALNIERAVNGQRPLGYGIGLHVGDVMYGNIGTPERLEFTVIGSAANEAARIESLCKTVGRSILTSAQFARHVPNQLESVGFHALRGLASEQELFTMV